ncbi:MAG: histidinol-phosphatase HisJ family protein [Massilimicrobiota timonensis]
MLCDYHVHTDYSDDSTYLMEDVVKDGIKKGLSEICFTDHVDYGIKYDWDDPRAFQTRDGMCFANVNYPEYTKEIAELKEKYKNQITLKMGLEFGIQTHTIQQYQKLFSQYPFDFIILSIHQVEDQEFWTQDFQKGKTQLEYNLGYYQELLDVIKVYKDYSVLGHLDLITRYDLEGTLDFAYIKDIVREILEIVIKDGKGIEINTSYYRYGLKDMTPSRDILKLYKELGGKIITIGSDSHKPEHLGAYIEAAKEELKKLGFEYYCTYDKMKPIFHEL